MKREHELGQTAEARKRTDRDLRCIGWGLVLLGVLMPALVTVENTGIYRTLMNGIYQGQEIYVLLAALKLVVLNAAAGLSPLHGRVFSGGDLPWGMERDGGCWPPSLRWAS